LAVANSFLQAHKANISSAFLHRFFDLLWNEKLLSRPDRVGMLADKDVFQNTELAEGGCSGRRPCLE
jgi:hypothetical protein